MKGERELDVGKFQASEVTNVMKTSAEIQTRLMKRIGNHTLKISYSMYNTAILLVK
jgi:hypothetical protein